MIYSRKSKGFSLIEVLIALVILSISLLGLASLMATTTQNNSFGSHMTEATTFAQDRLEALKVTPWLSLVSGQDAITSSTGINYVRTWRVVENAIVPPNVESTLKATTITVNWQDRTNHSIEFFTTIPNPDPTK